ncbi:tetratricopeptide repeat protein [candidate division KSB1 bacterium]|nr:tetratricopeptide repeat protein [candidate division KSB1 bacterium]
MKKAVCISLPVLLVLLMAIAFLKNRSSHDGSENDSNTKTLAEKERIKRFWEIYREATDHRMAGKIKEAAESYRHALALNGRHEDALYYLGNISLELGEYQTAEDSWQHLAQINPHSARAHLQLGNLYLSFGQKEFFNLDSAEAEFQKALQINQEETGPVLRLGHIALIRGDLPKAQHYFEAVIATNFKSVEAHFLNGYVARKAGNASKAKKLFSEAIKFSQAEKPVKGVMSEGDTKSGRPHALPETPKRHTLFQPYFGDLAEVDETSAAQQMQVRYQKLEAFLAQIREKAQDGGF